MAKPSNLKDSTTNNQQKTHVDGDSTINRRRILTMGTALAVASVSKPSVLKAAAVVTTPIMENVISMDSKRSARAPEQKKFRSKIKLTFVEDRSRTSAFGTGRNFWSVEPSGRYDVDCITGNEFAEEYLRYLAAGNLFPPIQWIVADMAVKISNQGELSGVDVGFLGTLTRAAAVGAITSEAVFRRGP